MPANQEWSSNTKVPLVIGESFSVYATGTWNGSPSSAGGPDGDGKKIQGVLATDLPSGSLIGRIGDNPPFFVGSHFSGKANGSGVLYLGMNDVPGLFRDNSGALDVTISLSTARSTANPLNLVMDSPKTLTVIFTRVFNLNTVVNPNSGGTITVNPASGPYDQGTLVEMSATASFPYRFERWTGTDNDNTNPTRVTMNADRSPVVFFSKLVTGTPQAKSGTIHNDGNPMPTIPLKAGQWVEGGVYLTGVNPNTQVSVLDPTFAIVQDLGVISNRDFRFQATKDGDYVVKIKANFVYSIGYTLKFTVYS